MEKKLENLSRATYAFSVTRPTPKKKSYAAYALKKERDIPFFLVTPPTLFLIRDLRQKKVSYTFQKKMQLALFAEKLHDLRFFDTRPAANKNMSYAF